MRDIAKEVGHQIRTERKLQGMSQEALAAKANLDRSYMGRVERGEVNVTLKALWEIAEAMDVSIKILIPDS